MTRFSFAQSVAELPVSVAIFPLTGALLLPGGQLPLNIFEPRYLAMIDDALASSRLIGMIQPSSNDALMGEAPVYKTGCLGRISAFSEADDNRYVLTLSGICRFTCNSDRLHDHGYRVADIDATQFQFDFEPEPNGSIDRKALTTALRAYFEKSGFSADWQRLDETADQQLVNSLAMALPFEAQEKQALLECNDLPSRTQLLQTLMTMATISKNEPTSPGGEIIH